MKINIILLGICFLPLIGCEKEYIDYSQAINDYKILFISQRIANCADWNVMIMNADGSDQALLTDFSTNFRKPVPDHAGKMVLFVRQMPNFSNELYAVRLDGTELTRLDSAGHTIGYPDWSSDDSKILYIKKDKGATLTELVLFDVASKSSSILLNSSVDLSAQFTPDNRILYVESDYPSKEAYIMNMDGTNPKHLLSGAYDITFSPDGKKIAFVSYTDNNAPQIFLANADGNPIRQLTSTHSISKDSGYPNYGNHDPHWTPDGKKIIYTSDINDGLPEIYSMISDGRFQKRLTDNPRRNEYPVVTPDGKFIVFTSNRDLDFSSDIFVMQLDGGNQHPLTLYPAKDCVPVLVQF